MKEQSHVKTNNKNINNNNFKTTNDYEEAIFTPRGSRSLSVHHS